MVLSAMEDETLIFPASSLDRWKNKETRLSVMSKIGTVTLGSRGKWAELIPSYINWISASPLLKITAMNHVSCLLLLAKGLNGGLGS